MDDPGPERLFIPGLELSERYFAAVVRPIVRRAAPELSYAACLLGLGSEVLGYDTPRSTDHDWAPTVQLVVPDSQADRIAAVQAALERELPDSFLGWPTQTDFGHRVFVFGFSEFRGWLLGHDLPPDPRQWSAAQWLSLPSQTLLGVTAGAVHHDGPGDLTRLRQGLSWYPRDVWLYALAAGWRLIAQEEHLMPRAGEAGDEPGSAIIGARLVQAVMALTFLQERRYAPYAKWFGTAFAELQSAPLLLPDLHAALEARDWPSRMAASVQASSSLLRLHNQLGLTVPLDPSPQAFHDRPFQVLDAERVALHLLSELHDPEVIRLAGLPLIGTLDLLTQSTDARRSEWRAAFHDLYARTGLG